MARIGTSYFKDRAAAVRYYRNYEGANAEDAVTRKLAEGQIHLGEPPHKPGDTLRLIDNGTRWEIEETQ